jgi:hypothetical protein
MVHLLGAEMRTLLLFFVFAFLVSASNAAVNYAAIVNQTGDVTKHLFDANSTSYADAGINKNTFLRLCASSASDIQGKYVGWVYLAGSDFVQLNSFFGAPLGNLLPVLSVDAQNCTKVDLDFSSTKAYYPGVPTAVISDDNTLDIGDTFFEPNSTTAFLNGTYSFDKHDLGASVSVNVTAVRSHTGSLITAVRPNLAVALLRADTLQVLSSDITSPGQEVTLTEAAYAGETAVIINGLVFFETPAAGGGAGGGFVRPITSSCDLTTHELSIGSIQANVPEEMPGGFCQDLRVSSLLVNRPLNGLEIKIERKSLPFTIPAFGGERDRNYQTFEISDNIDDNDVVEVEYQFRIPKTWMDNNAIITEQASLVRFDGSSWQELSAALTGSDDEYYYYEARTNSLSYFIIYGPQVDIWYVLQVVDRYYQERTSFLEVIGALSKYYTIY